MKTASLLKGLARRLSLVALLFCATIDLRAQSRLSLFPIHRNWAITYNTNLYFYATRNVKGSFTLFLFDQDRHPIDSVQLVRSRSFFALQVADNGTTLAFAGFDNRTRVLELITYDRRLSPIATTSRILSYYPPSNRIVRPLANDRFSMSLLSNNNPWRYRIELLNNQLKTLSETERSRRANLQTKINIFHDDSISGYLIEKKKRRNGKDFSYDLQVVDPKKDTTLFRVPVVADGHPVAVSYAHHDLSTNTYTVFGEYYAKDVHMGDSRSLGFMTVVYDSVGKIARRWAVSWEEMSKLSSPSGSEAFQDKKKRLYIHRILQTSNGKIFVIGEQFRKIPISNFFSTKKTVLVAGRRRLPHRYVFHSNLTTTGLTQMRVSDLVIFQFNSNFKLDSVRVFHKKSRVQHVPKITVMSPKFASQFRSTYGCFDYKFIQMSPDKSGFLIAYVDFDGMWNHSSLAYLLGCIRYSPEEGFVSNKFAIKRNYARFEIYNARPGYVEIRERRSPWDASVDVRLEKLKTVID